MSEMVYDKEYVRERLQTGIVRVTFDKVNGERRVMTCTLQEKYLPPTVGDMGDMKFTTAGEMVAQKAERPEPKDSLAVWDLNANGWRSFRIDKIIAIEEGVTYP